MGKGTRWERNLVSTLQDAGWGLIRSGGSGSGTKEDRPDLVAGDGQRLWVIEAKYCSDANVYVEPGEVDQILVIARAFDATPMIAVRWNANQIDAVEADWYLFNPFVAERTDGGRYVLRAGSADTVAVKLGDVI